MDSYFDGEWRQFDDLYPNDWNPNKMSDEEFEILKDSLRDNGWTMPIVIQPDGTIIDGEHRWRASNEIDEDLTPEDIPSDYVPVHSIDIDDDRARIATIQHNRARGDISYDRLSSFRDELKEIGIFGEVEDKLAMDEVRDVIRLDDQYDMPDDFGLSSDVFEDSSDSSTTSTDSTDSVSSDLSEDSPDVVTLSFELTLDEYHTVTEALGETNRSKSLAQLVDLYMDKD
jgi:hypothetical protein